MFRPLLILPIAVLAWAPLITGAHAPNLDASHPAYAAQAQVQPARAVTIVGSVVDSSLTPLAGIAVVLERDGRVVARTTSDSSGVFRFTGIAPGDYRVRAEHSGFPAFTRNLHVPAGVTGVQLPLVLARPGDEEAREKARDSQQPVTASGASPRVMPAPASPAGGAGGGRGGGVVDGLVGGVQRAPVQGQGQGQGASQGSATPQRQFAPATAGRGAAPVWLGDPRYRDRIDVPFGAYRYPHSGESYAHVEPNRFQPAQSQPLSTFGADVDTASYSNVRRFLSNGQLPPRDAVRIEEFVNYFRFPYDEPRDGRPLRLTTEVGDCPWAPTHKLVLIGARARASAPREIEGRNIVLLVDVSGSMAPPERLPLIKTALGMFVDTLQPTDRLAIVTYAGSSGIALPSTPARQRDVIQRAIANLSAGGSTNGGQGLIMAYRVAREAFIPGGVNRVILATDGDFNVGVVNQVDLVHLIEREKSSGVFLSVFGVGSGNLKDSTMEMLADKGNGHYAYLDSLQEARRVLLREADATLETVAKDVKFQVEFNPAMVNAWKLIGYEDRLLAAEDFNDDRKDGGEIGAGHTVTVLYEVIPAGVQNRDDGRGSRPEVDPLKYQAAPAPAPARLDADVAPGEWLTVKARYKTPEGQESALISQPLRSGGRVQHLPLASAVVELGLLLRSGSRDAERWNSLERRAARLDPAAALRSDVDGFKELVNIAASLARLR